MPPWINKFYILDMQPKNSMVRYLVAQGFTVFMVSWKNPDASMEDIEFRGLHGPRAAGGQRRGARHHRQPNRKRDGLLHRRHAAGDDAGLAGGKGDERFKAATFMVSMQDFSRVGDTAVFMEEPTIDFIEQQMMERGYLDSREMSNMFNLLRSNDLIWSNVVNNYLLGQKPPAFDLLYWNSDGTRMAPRRAQLVPAQHLCREQPDQAGQGGAEGRADRPWPHHARHLRGGRGERSHRALGCGVAHHAADRRRGALCAGLLRPYRRNHQSARRQGRLLDERDRPGTCQRRDWRQGAAQHEGSWWTDWTAWLAKRSGERSNPPPMGSAGTSHFRMRPAHTCSRGEHGRTSGGQGTGIRQLGGTRTCNPPASLETPGDRRCPRWQLTNCIAAATSAMPRRACNARTTGARDQSGSAAAI